MIEFGVVDGRQYITGVRRETFFVGVSEPPFSLYSVPSLLILHSSCLDRGLLMVTGRTIRGQEKASSQTLVK
jgi:hypothetical protein